MKDLQNGVIAGIVGGIVGIIVTKYSGGQI